MSTSSPQRKNPVTVSMALSDPPRVLFFDVFGTCVDWRTTVTERLNEAAHESLRAPYSSIASTVRMTASDMSKEDWGRFAQEWRNSYKQFTWTVAMNEDMPWKTVDEHHSDSLKELLRKWDLEGLWIPEDVQELSLIWHCLDPWPDAARGISALNARYDTCTLSNGNLSLLNDLAVHGEIDWTYMFSAEDFGTYKPSDKVYHGAIERLNEERRKKGYAEVTHSQCVMVAAHLADLQAARNCGMKTIYVEREGEEDWDEARIAKAKEERFVDMWITLEEDGFLAMAQKLGCALDKSRSRSKSCQAALASPTEKPV